MATPFLVSTALMAFPSLAHATSIAWAAAVDGNWSDGTKWTGGTAPGSTSSTTNADVATDNTGGGGVNTITVDANRNVQSITLNWSANNGGKTFSGGNLLLTSGGTLSKASGGGANTNTFNTPIALENLGAGTSGTYTFSNLSTVTNNNLVIAGGVTGAATGVGVTTLTLTGANVAGQGGTNSISGIIGDGSGGGKLAITKTNLNTWTLSGPNTYTGTTAVNGGTLAVSGSGTLGNGAPLTMGGGTLDLGTLSETVGAVSITAPAASGDTIQNGSLTGTSYAASNTSGTATISANLLVDGGAGFAKSGAGTVNLSGTNTYSGGGTVTAGTLTYLNTNAKPGSGTNTVSNGATLGLGVGGAGFFSAANLDSAFANTLTGVNYGATAIVGVDTTAGDFVYSSNIASSTRGLTKLGNNTLTLSGTNAYTGTTTDNSGKLVVSGTGSTMGAVTHNNGMFLVNGTGTMGAINVNNTGNQANGWFEIASGANYTATSLNVAGVANNATVMHMTGGQLTVSGGVTIGAGTGIGNSEISYLYMSNGNISAGSDIHIGGNNANNTNTQSLAVMSGGMLTTSGNFFVGTSNNGGANMVMGSGATTVNGAGGTTIGPYSRAGSGAGASLYLAGNSVFATKQILRSTAPNPAGFGQSLTVYFNGGTLQALADSTTLLGSRSSTAQGNTSLTNAGIANLAYLFAGGATFNSNGHNVTVNPDLIGDTINATANTLSVGPVSLATVGSGYSIAPTVTFSAAPTGGTTATGYAALDSNGSVSVIVTDPGTYSSAPTVTISGGTLGPGGTAASGTSATVATISSTGGGLTKTGLGTMIVVGNNAYTGPTTISGGVLSIGSIANGGFSLPTITTTAASANVAITNGADTGLAAGQTVYSSKVPYGYTILSVTDTTHFVLSSGTSVTAGTSIGSTIGFANPLGISSSAPTNLVFDGGTLQYTGPTAVSDRAFTINTGKTATIDVTNGLTLAGATGTATNGALTKIGAGTLTLTGNSTYTGTTTVSAGTLALSTATTNNIASSALISLSTLGSGLDVTNVSGAGGFALSSGQTLKGIGTVTGNLTVAANSTISPGNSPGIINNSGIETWKGLGNYKFEINSAAGTVGTNWDEVNITGSLVLNSSFGSPFSILLNSLTLSNSPGQLSDFNSATHYDWLIAQSTSPIGTFTGSNQFVVNTSAFTAPSAFSPSSFSVVLGTSVGGGTNEQLYLDYNPAGATVPEPSTLLLAVAGLAGLGLIARRRRRAA